MPVKKRKRSRATTKSLKNAEPLCSEQAIAAGAGSRSTKNDKKQNRNEGNTDSSPHVEAAASVQVNGTQEAQSNDTASLLSDGPVVLQCSRCRSIVADTSSAMLNWDKERETISFSSVRGIKLSSEVIATISGSYSNCAYREMQCEHCEQAVGRRYVSTTTEFDSIRSAFIFDLPCLVTYKLRSVNPESGTTAKKPVSSDTPVSSIAPLLGTMHDVCDSVHELIVWMRAMQDENAQLRQNFLALENRLQRLENSCSDQ